MRNLRRLFTIIFCFGSFLALNAQTARLYTSGDGLANSHSHHIYQDSKGFIWISTGNGLSKFDGMKFSTFSFDRKKENSIASNFVRVTFEDSKGRFWVGTSAGLQTFDREYNIFSAINLEDWSMPESDQHVTAVMETEILGNNSIVVSTSGHGIYILDADSLTVRHNHQKLINKAIPSQFISNLYKDSRDWLWIISDIGGISAFDLKNGEQINDIWPEGTRGRVRNDGYYAAIEDPGTGNVILGSFKNGVMIYDASTGKIRPSKGSLSRKHTVISMIPDNISGSNNGRTFLAGIENDGLMIFDAEKEELREMNFPNVPFSISEWKIHCLCEDNQGNVWAGALQTGVLVIPKSMYGFEYVNLEEAGSLKNISVTSIINDEDKGILWVGTDGNGLYAVDRDGKSRNFTDHNSSLSNNSIMSMQIDKRGRLWIATYLGGLITYTPKEGFRQFKGQGDLRAAKVYCIEYSEAEDIIYVGTHGRGIAMIDAAEETVIRKWDEDRNKWVSSLYLDSSGLLWIGTYNGPMAYDSRNDQFIEYNTLDDKSVRVNAFYEDHDGKIWIGTGDGLVYMNGSGKDIKIYTEENGLPSNSVTNILEDNEGCLWISTMKGLSRFNRKEDRFTNYYQHDGLQENEFNSKAAFEDKDGKMYFGTIKGLTSFDPRRIAQRKTDVPPLHIASLNVMNRNIEYDPSEKDGNILDKHISEASRITLPYNAGNFSIEFAVLEYTNPQKIKYAYKIDGFEKDWNYTLSNSRTATYTNIPSGRYTMKVKAFYDGEPESVSYKEIALRIMPPWYITFWAWILYAIALITIVYSAIEYTRRQKAYKAKQEESEIKEMKLQMFTNLSHEIRTPLTLVISPLKKIREAEEDPQMKNLYNLMYRNSLRILRMVNQLMDMRKVDNGQLQLHFLETDIIFFIKDIMQSFENLAESKKVNFTIKTDEEAASLWIDQGNFDKIIFNILSNAFKYTPEEGEISISVKSGIKNYGILTENIAEYAEIIIENTGSTIEEKHLERVFDRFYQTSIKDANIGSGVGLHLTKMLVELHHGEISVYNTENGVAFRVRIPMGNVHLTEEEMTKPENHKDLYTKSEVDTSISDAVTPSEINDEETEIAKSKMTIVLVDDDSEMRSYIKMELQKLYNVVACANGKEGWAKISSIIPDAVVTDLIMDKMDGAELCEKIKKNPGTNHIPVILLTSSSDEISLHRCIDSGADRFFTKPISMEILKSAISKAITAKDTIKNKYSRDIDYGYDTIKIPDSDNQLAVKVISIIRDHIEDTRFSVEELSHEVGMSRVHLNRKLKETMNISPSNLIRSIRLKQAAYLLINNKVNISEVAYRVGFSTHSYFSNSFHDYFGMTPKEFVAKYMDCTDEETLKKLFE